jgi:hypothetical protein
MIIKIIAYFGRNIPKREMIAENLKRFADIL